MSRGFASYLSEELLEGITSNDVGVSLQTRLSDSLL